MNGIKLNRTVDVAIIGAGTAGLAAMSQVRRATDNFVLINGGELGTTCARVGCMPSKAIIQVAEDFHRRHIFDRLGIDGDDYLTLDRREAMEHTRDLRDIFVDRVLAGTTDNLDDKFIDGYARYIEPDVLEVAGQRIRAANSVIATGSSPIIPKAWQVFADRVLTTDNLFEQDDLPESVAVAGLGVIGVELGQALSRMGVAVTGVDMLETIGGITDPVVNQTAVGLLGKEFPLWLGHEIEVRDDEGKLAVTSGEQCVHVDKILACLGRRPNLERLGLRGIGINTDARGMPQYNPHTMQIHDMPIFIAGDVNAERQILHEAADEGRIAGSNAVAAEVVCYRRRIPLAITFTDPNIAHVGLPFSELEQEQVVIGEIRFGPVGRALLMGKNKGVLRVYGNRQHGRLLGASMIAPNGEHLAHLLAWSMQQDQSVFDLLKMPFYHPAIEEGLQAALRDLRKQVVGQSEDVLELARLNGSPRTPV